MIYSLSGKLTYVSEQFVVIECGGVGFKCFTSLNTAKTVGSVGSAVSLFTHLSVKEDALDLYGFATHDELDCFRLLISVSGVGPKAAVSVLSELSPQKLALAVAAGDVKAITKANGVGKKIAERIALELKDKLVGTVGGEIAAAPPLQSLKSLLRQRLLRRLFRSASAKAMPRLPSAQWINRLPPMK